MPPPPTPRTHRRLTFPRPDRPVPDYVNLYRYGSPDQPGPLLLYVGGAITEHNTGDALPPPATALGAFDPRLKPWVMPGRPGGHGFGSYAANGSVAEALGFALDLLG